MNKYDVIIERIESKRHHGFRYQVTIYWNRVEGAGEVGWTLTRWGARRLAKKMARKHELPDPKSEVVEEYSL